MEYSLRAMELWFQHLPGSMLLQLETDALSSWFEHISGMHCLQIGGPSNLAMIKSANYLHKTYLSPQYGSAMHHARIQSSLDELPFLRSSIDAIVLTHMLEFSISPRQFIKETHRILAPSGQLILFSFNPWSLWGITRHRRNKRGFPWAGNFYSGLRIKTWLRQAGYSILLSKTLSFRPPLHDIKRCNRWAFMETVGAYCFPGWGAVSFMIAQKKELGVTPIKISWNRRLVKVGGIIEPTTYR